MSMKSVLMNICEGQLKLRKPLEEDDDWKPYSGKLNIRFDEGEMEIELPDVATTPALYSFVEIIESSIFSYKLVALAL